MRIRRHRRANPNHRRGNRNNYPLTRPTASIQWILNRDELPLDPNSLSDWSTLPPHFWLSQTQTNKRRRQKERKAERETQRDRDTDTDTDTERDTEREMGGWREKCIYNATRWKLLEVVKNSLFHYKRFNDGELPELKRAILNPIFITKQQCIIVRYETSKVVFFPLSFSYIYIHKYMSVCIKYSL